MLTQLLLLILQQQAYGQCTCVDFIGNQQCVNFANCAWNGKTCYQPQCESILEQEQCSAPQCAWYLDTCHDGQSCNFYTDKQICNRVFGCVFNDGYCLPYEDCSFTTQQQCNGVTPSGIQCFWNQNSQNCIKYQSCNRLSLDNNDCNSIPYCIQKKNECLDFNDLSCGDMTTQTECSRMAPYQCSWYQNECISYPCTKYQTQSSCTQNRCTWNGIKCLYCPIHQSLDQILRLILLIIVLFQ